MKVFRARRGFTLIELIVVVMIIGVLAAFGVPQYFKTIETSKADDASALTAMIGTTNRMYALDHSNTYTAGTLTSACNTETCPASGGVGHVCNLVSCKYLAQQDWDNKPYRLGSDNPATSSICTGAGFGITGSNFTACAARRTGAMSPYNGWGYGVTAAGGFAVKGTAPTPVTP